MRLQGIRSFVVSLVLLSSIIGLSSCKFGSQTGSAGDAYQPQQVKSADQLTQFMQTLTPHEHPGFVLDKNVKYMLGVEFAWSKDKDCEQTFITTSIPGKAEIKNTQDRVYTLNPEAYEIIDKYSGTYQGKSIRELANSFRFNLTVQTVSGHTFTEIGKCFHVGHVDNGVGEAASFSWPSSDPCLQEGFTPVLDNPNKQWHSFATLGSCINEFNSTGLMESGVRLPRMTGEPPHGAGLYCQCNHISWDGESLTACCEKMDLHWQKTTLDYAKTCIAGEAVGNYDGRLGCSSNPPLIFYPIIMDQTQTPYAKDFCSFSGFMNDAKYVCANRQISESHIDFTKCDESGAKLYLPKYNGNYGHLECASTAKNIGLDQDSTAANNYLKILLNPSSGNDFADTYIHCNAGGKCYLDYYNNQGSYNSKEFSSADELKNYVLKEHPMNADGFLAEADSDNNVKNGYLYINEDGSKGSCPWFSWWVKRNGTDDTCLLANAYACTEYTMCLKIDTSQDHTNSCGLGVRLTDVIKHQGGHAKAQIDGNLVSYGDNEKHRSSTRSYGMKFPNYYTVFHLEDKENSCALVTMRGTHRYQYVSTKNTDGKWQNY